MAEALAAAGRRHHRRERDARADRQRDRARGDSARPRVRGHRLRLRRSATPSQALGARARRTGASTSWSTTPARSSARRPPSTRSTGGTTCSRSICPASSCSPRRSAAGCSSAAAARSSSPRRCSASRAASTCPATRRRSRASPGSPRRSPTSGPRAGVTVNAIAPGYIATDNTQALQDDPDRSRRDPRAHPGRPLGPRRRPRRRHRVPRLAGVRLRLGQSCCRSTADGSADELRRARSDDHPIVPVIVIDDAARAVDLARALLAGGIGCAEITLRTPAALDAIRPWQRCPSSPSAPARCSRREQVREAAHWPGPFIVSPGSIARSSRPRRARPRRAARHRHGDRGHARPARGPRRGQVLPRRSPRRTRDHPRSRGPFPQLGFVPSGGVTAASAAEYLAHPRCPRSAELDGATRLIAARDFAAIERLSAEIRRDDRWTMTGVVTLGETMGLFAATAPEPLGDVFRLRIGGAESNVAIGVARLGVRHLDRPGRRRRCRRSIRAASCGPRASTPGAVDTAAPTGLMVKTRSPCVHAPASTTTARKRGQPPGPG